MSRSRARLVAGCVVGFLVLGACRAGDGPVTACDKPWGDASAAQEELQEPLDALEICIEFSATEVASGDELRTRIRVDNDSGGPVVDRDCGLGASRWALIPAQDPDAELWLAIIVECAGPRTIPEGFSETSSGPTFPAHDKFGRSLPPGDYLAVWETESWSGRIEQPITVTP